MGGRDLTNNEEEVAENGAKKGGFGEQENRKENGYFHSSETSPLVISEMSKSPCSQHFEKFSSSQRSSSWRR